MFEKMEHYQNYLCTFDKLFSLSKFNHFNKKPKFHKFHVKGLLKFALEFYCNQLLDVLSSFGKSPKCVNLPENTQDLVKVIKRCVILDFLNVVVIK